MDYFSAKLSLPHRIALCAHAEVILSVFKIHFILIRPVLRRFRRRPCGFEETVVCEGSPWETENMSPLFHTPIAVLYVLNLELI